MYYILSLLHSAKHEKFLTLWRPNNAGYCYSRQMAGVYERAEQGYHDNDGNMSIPVDEAHKLMNLFLLREFGYIPKYMIPNNKATLRKLKLKRVKGQLTRI